MAETLKVLGQAALAATTLTDIYTVPASTQAVISSIQVAERSGVATTVRISIAPAGAADALAHYIRYDAALAANGEIEIKGGLTLAATDVIRAYAGAATVSVSIFGAEKQ